MKAYVNDPVTAGSIFRVIGYVPGEIGVVELENISDEIAQLQDKIAFSSKWYAVRIRPLEDFFRNEGKDLPIATTFWSILANGHRSPSEPPTYDHILVGKDHRIKQLEAERDEAQKNYQWMVNNAAKTKLDGYRELGQKAADAENKLDVAHDRIKRLEDWLVEVHAKHIPMTCRYDDMEGRCVFEDDGWCKNCKQKDKMRGMAREQLQAEGKL